MGRNPTRTNEPVDSCPYGKSVIPTSRLNFLVEKCKRTLQQTPGNVLEVGVYKGGTLLGLTAALREVCPQFKVFGIDTFTGHPYTDGHPIHPQGKYGDVDLDELERLIDSRNLRSWVRLYRGRVEEIFEDLQLANISFAHIDCDLYAPVKYCAEKVQGVMNRGGVLYFDDYGHEHCPGATRAVEEVFGRSRLKEVRIAEDNTCWSCYLQIVPRW
jgi:O-methyltransferase